MNFDSIVVNNMLNRPNYVPYCGNNIARHLPNGCDNPRVKFSTKALQFVCPHCGWTSKHPDKLIHDYMKFNNIVTS